MLFMCLRDVKDRMSIVYTLTSDDPEHYGRIKFNASPSVDSKVRYRVKSISTFSMFSITTNEDFIVVSRDGISMKHFFKDRTSYLDLPREVEDVVNQGIISSDGSDDNYLIHATYNENGMLKLTCQHKISIVDASHRVRLLMGYYNVSLPTVDDYTLTSPSMPLTCFGNVLYLRCKSGIVVGSNESSIYSLWMRTVLRTATRR